MNVDPYCPYCDQPVSLDDVNVARDLALCRACRTTFSFADAHGADCPASEFDPESCAGAWHESRQDGFEVGASMWSRVNAIGLPIFAVLWNGVVIAGLYGTPSGSPGHYWVQRRFVVPFLLAGLGIIWLTAMVFVGHVAISVVGDEGKIDAGIGRIGWTRRFAWSEVRGAGRALKSSPGESGGPQWVVRILGDKNLDFGAYLSEQKQDFLVAAIRHELRRRPPNPNPRSSPIFPEG